MAHARSLTGYIKNLFNFVHLDDTVWAEADEKTYDNIIRGDATHFTFGAADNQVNLVYHARLTAAAAPVVLDLTDDSLVDEFGGGLNFSHVKGLQIVNLDPTNGLDVLGPTATELLTLLVPAGVNVVDHIYLPPLGNVAFVNPLAGWATNAGVADEIEIDPGINTVIFDVTIVGIGIRTELT